MIRNVSSVIRRLRNDLGDLHGDAGRVGVMIYDRLAFVVLPASSRDHETVTENTRESIRHLERLTRPWNWLVVIADDAQRLPRTTVAAQNWRDARKVSQMVLPWSPIPATGSDMGVPPGDADTDKTDSLRYPGCKSSTRHRLGTNRLGF